MRNTYESYGNGNGQYSGGFGGEQAQPRNTAPESGYNQIRIQGLEEVTEMSEESDVTSQLSNFEKDDPLNQSNSSIASGDSETNERM